MNRKGYYRWLLTYLPTFFIIISLLIVIFFMAMSNYSKRQTVLANEAFAGHVTQAIDSSLRHIENMMIRELLADDKLTRFYGNRYPLAPYDSYEISQTIQEMAVAAPPVHSIYLYRSADRRVLSPNRLVAVEQFGDRDFIERSLGTPSPYVWTESRLYEEFEGSLGGTEVVSMVKRVPVGIGGDGLLVVNVRASSIQELFHTFSDMDDVYVRLFDRNEAPLFGELLPESRQLSEVRSSYTGWITRSGLKSTQAYDFLSAVSNVWSGLALLTVLAGTVTMVYMIRRNYRPIETIRSRIEPYASPKSRHEPDRREDDEFHFISASIEHLIETSKSHERSYKENLEFRKRWFFDELLEGQRPIGPDEWRRETRRLGLPESIGQLAVAVLEIDRYADFSSSYAYKDQQLVKLALESVVRETAQTRPFGLWMEWVHHAQAGLLFTWTGRDERGLSEVYDMCEAVRGWVEQNMKFTVSFGVGDVVYAVRETSQSYRNGREALQYKTYLGINRTIGHWEVDGLEQGQIYRHLPDIRLMAQHYRLGEEEWKHNLQQLFLRMKTVIAPRDELLNLFHYVIFSLHKEISALPPGIQAAWEQTTLQPLHQMLNSFDGLNEAEARFFDLLDKGARLLESMREERDNHKLIVGVRQYISENYANQDLSLNHLSDAFQINLKSLSRIFKEEFGENFVDYLTKTRVERAKELLVRLPDVSVQDIAQMVGYAHSISFIRVFKKLEGATPGDYRKENGEGAKRLRSRI